jgi:hypothetical protein
MPAAESLSGPAAAEAPIDCSSSLHLVPQCQARANSVMHHHHHHHSSLLKWSTKQVSVPGLGVYSVMHSINMKQQEGQPEIYIISPQMAGWQCLS